MRTDLCFSVNTSGFCAQMLTQEEVFIMCTCPIGVSITLTTLEIDELDSEVKGLTGSVLLLEHNQL